MTARRDAGVLNPAFAICTANGGPSYMRDDVMRLGADVESYVSSSHLRVYKPTGDALRTIVNYVDPPRAARGVQEATRRGFAQPPEPFRIGTVRYTSTDRMHRNG